MAKLRLGKNIDELEPASLDRAALQVVEWRRAEAAQAEQRRAKRDRQLPMSLAGSEDA